MDMMTKNKLPQAALGYIRGHQVEGAFMESLLATLTYDSHVWKVLQNRVVPTHCPHYFNVGRNNFIKQFLAETDESVEVLISLDTDQVFAPEQVMHLLALVDPVERPVVSGLYHACDNLGEQVRPLVMKRHADGGLHCEWDFPSDQLVEVDAVGMGFCAIHRQALLELREGIGEHWFDFDETARSDFMPEDDAFCRRVQEMLGKKIYVHTGIDIGHVKPCLLRATNARRKPRAVGDPLKL
jgi:hypothetical protein